MKVRYDKLWRLMKDNKMKKSDLSKAAEISSYAMTKLNNDRPVSMEVMIKDYKGVPPAQPICDSYRRSCVARRLLWRTETARFLLPDKPCADKEIPLRVGGVPAALLRHLQLSKRSGASRGGGHHRGISAAKRYDGIYRHF